MIKKKKKKENKRKETVVSYKGLLSNARCMGESM
jgi:hypothetical protein